MNVSDLLNKPNIIKGTGPLPADILLLGEAPGADEERSGVPFVGPAGRKLREVLLPAAGIDIEHCRIENVIQTRPPNNATPPDPAIERAKPELYDRLARVNPKVIIALGATAAKALDIRDKVSTVRGKSFERRGYKVIPMYHPAAALHNPTIAEDILSDWKTLGEYLRTYHGLATSAPSDTPWVPTTNYRLATGAEAIAYLRGCRDILHRPGNH